MKQELLWKVADFLTRKYIYDVFVEDDADDYIMVNNRVVYVTDKPLYKVDFDKVRQWFDEPLGIASITEVGPERYMIKYRELEE